MNPQCRLTRLVLMMSVWTLLGVSSRVHALESGPVVAWGGNGSGQCNVPAPNAGFTAVAAGHDFSLGLKTDGSITVWGNSTPPTPNTGFTAIAAGHDFGLGLKANGSIAAWGNSTVPTPNTGFTAIVAGYDFGLGLKTNGSIAAWGNSTVPGQNTGFMAIAAGHDFGLGLKGDGSIAAWGNSTVPGQNTGFVAIAAGHDFGLGLKGDGSIVPWGNGAVPVPLPNTGFVAIAAGYAHSLGLKADGSIVAWGNNANGQVSVPIPNGGFTAVAAGNAHSLGLKAVPCSPTSTCPSTGSTSAKYLISGNANNTPWSWRIVSPDCSFQTLSDPSVPGVATGGDALDVALAFRDSINSTSCTTGISASAGYSLSTPPNAELTINVDANGFDLWVGPAGTLSLCHVMYNLPACTFNPTIRKIGNAATCQGTVCGMDPFCCRVTWDNICADEATSLCSCCDGASGGSCNCCSPDPAGAPGCEDDPCLESCDDNEPCTADSCDPVLGCMHAQGLPPDEVDNGLRLSGGSATQIIWNLASGSSSSDVVRGELSGLPVGPGGGDEFCLAGTLPGTLAMDDTNPAPGSGFWYLVRGRSSCGSGTYGFRSNGIERLTGTCP